MRRLFAVRNERGRGAAVERGYDYKGFGKQRGFGGHHSGGLVVVGQSLEEAQEMFIKSLGPDHVDDFRHIAEMLEEFPLYVSAGVVLFASGDC